MSFVVLINPFRVSGPLREAYVDRYRAVMETLSQQPGFLGGGLHVALEPDNSPFQFINVNRWASADAFYQGMAQVKPARIFGELTAQIEANPALYQLQHEYPPAGVASDEEAVRQAERDWVEIYTRNDADALSELLSEDFNYTSPVCEVVDRRTYLTNLRERIVQMEYAHTSDLLVRIHGQTAVVTASWNVKESYRGSAFSGPCRITRVWSKQSGRWRAITFQVTECPQR